MFPVRDVSKWQVVRAETLGRDRKVWLRHPAIAIDSQSREGDWLYKPVVVPANGIAQGEDWAEKIVSELGRLLGVPCAEVDLAVRGRERGLISRNVIPDGWVRVLGAELMGTVVPNYQEGRYNPPGRPGHSPELIAEALTACGPAPGCEHLDAMGAFAGYLVLDAWVANQDRHDQNWAVMARSGSQELRLDRPEARRHWITRLRGVEPAAVEEVVRRTPNLSDIAARFVVELLDINRRRLLDDC